MPDDPPTPYDKPDDRIDYKLANLLHGDHPIGGTQEQRVVQLHELEILHNATLQAGWTRHTGDWDWGGEVTMKDGEKIGDTLWSIELVLPDGVKSKDFCATVDWAKVTHVRLEGQGWNKDEDDPYEIARDVHVNQITNVYWEQR